MKESMKLEELNSSLSELFSTMEFEESGGIHITGTDWHEDDLKIEFVINTGLEDGHQLWEAQITGVREELIKADWVEELVIKEEHPLLWKYNNVQTELYFSQATDRPYELLNDILEAHFKVTAGWYDLHNFINWSHYTSLIELCKSSNALFAKGPKKILEQYAKVLGTYTMKPNLFGEWNPKRWVGDQMINEDKPLSILLIGKSYVIAEKFNFVRV